MTTNHLRIGPLDFVLNISVDDETAYTTNRNNYMRKWRQNWDHSFGIYKCLDPLPRPTHLRLGDVIIYQTISRGAFGVVRVGVDRRSGDVVACKTIHCHRRHDAYMVMNEIRIASIIPLSMVGVVHLIGSSCEHGHSPPCFGNVLEDVHLIMPYAPFSFETTAWHEITLATRLKLFRQVLEGLGNLHTAGIMHRDISPRNLLVFSYQPPVAAICDFGKSKHGIKGKESRLGPPAFTAPEPGRQEEYTNAIDMFSLGLSMLASFQGCRWAGPLSDAGNYTRVLDHLANLQGHMPDDLVALLRSMLAWDPSDRPTAEQALADKIWEKVAVVPPGSETETARGTPNTEESSGPGPTITRLKRQRPANPSASGFGSSDGDKKRMRRSDVPSRSEVDFDKRRQRSAVALGVRKQGLRTSTSLLSPPPM